MVTNNGHFNLMKITSNFFETWSTGTIQYFILKPLLVSAFTYTIFREQSNWIIYKISSFPVILLAKSKKAALDFNAWLKKNLLIFVLLKYVQKSLLVFFLNYRE